MKKIIAMLLVVVMALGLCACAAKTETPAEEPATETPAVETPAAEEPAEEEPAEEEPASENQHFEKLTLEFVPSKDADVIIASTKNLPDLLKAELSKLGVDIDEIDITVGTNYDATGEAMAAGAIDLGWLPGGTYALYSDDTDVILTATRAGLSNESETPADWNGDENATTQTDKQVTYYRALIYATPSAYGKELAAKANAGETITWEDLDKATWAVQKTSSSAGYIYPSLWLMENYDGRTIADLSNVMPVDSGYGTVFSYAAAESVDVIVCYADGRVDYAPCWTLPTDQQDESGKQGMGRPESVWNELCVIGVTEGIYNDTVAISKESPYYTPEMVAILQDALINVISTEEGRECFGAYSHTGYAKAVDSDYDGARAALALVSG